MSKRLIAVCMALAVFAVVPSLASAKPVITHPTGTVLATGTSITGTNVGETTLVTSTGTLSCSKDVLTGTLKKNSTAEGIEGEVTSATFAGTGAEVNGEKECTGSNFFTPNTNITPSPATNGLPWCLAATGTTDEGTVKGGPCGSSRPIRFALDVTGVGTCVYERTTTVPATIDTDTSGQDALITVTNQSWPLLEGPGLCPSSGALNMTFTLETDVATPTPLYFSS